MALLLGPDGARAVLAEHGGVAYHDDGTAELIGPIARLQVRAIAPGSMRVRLPRPAG
jgi:hypothetical protein